MRVFLSYTNDKLELYAKQIVSDGIDLFKSSASSKKDEESKHSGSKKAKSVK
jgi:hypothetical protein